MKLPYHNTQIRHMNPGAKNPLILPILLICNTSDDQLYANIRANSKATNKWVKCHPEHDKVAVLIGGGPSLSDDLEEVRQWSERGATIFAMNGAANFLHKHGILADYQVMIDARVETADLIGPAKNHLFASQVHPECFKRKPDAWLWHLQIENIDDCLPDFEDDFMMVGGAASVGNTATCLAYAMGYREIHCYGYDSSHKEENGHAYSQPLNNGEPCAFVDFNGKTYKTSLTMKLQAEKFPETARELQKLGVSVHVHGSGLLPDIWNTKLSEREKYTEMWRREEYRQVSPGEYAAKTFAEVVKPDPGKIIGDWGCGTGRGGMAVNNMTDCRVIMVDFTDNSRDEAAKTFEFIQADLDLPLPIWVDYGYCCDVMEHIPTDNVEKVINNIMRASKEGCFFQISTIPDVMGEEIGQELHLTVRPHSWWRELFTSLGYAVAWEQEQDIAALFYILNRSN